MIEIVVAGLLSLAALVLAWILGRSRPFRKRESTDTIDPRQHQGREPDPTAPDPIPDEEAPDHESGMDSNNPAGDFLDEYYGRSSDD